MLRPEGERSACGEERAQTLDHSSPAWTVEGSNN